MIISTIMIVLTLVLVVILVVVLTREAQQPAADPGEWQNRVPASKDQRPPAKPKADETLSTGNHAAGYA